MNLLTEYTEAIIKLKENIAAIRTGSCYLCHHVIQWLGSEIHLHTVIWQIWAHKYRKQDFNRVLNVQMFVKQFIVRGSKKNKTRLRW